MPILFLFLFRSNSPVPSDLVPSVLPVPVPSVPVPLSSSVRHCSVCPGPNPISSVPVPLPVPTVPVPPRCTFPSATPGPSLSWSQAPSHLIRSHLRSRLSRLSRRSRPTSPVYVPDQTLVPSVPVSLQSRLPSPTLCPVCPSLTLGLAGDPVPSVAVLLSVAIPLSGPVRRRSVCPSRNFGPGSPGPIPGELETWDRRQSVTLT